MYNGRLRRVRVNWSDKTKQLASCCLALIGAIATGIADPADQVRNSIDAFVLAELEAKGLKPAPPADKITLIRRATFDLIGLPPTPEEVEAFLADDSSKAFDKVVERL